MRHLVRALLVLFVVLLFGSIATSVAGVRKTSVSVPRLTSKQFDIKDAFDECIAKSTSTNPVDGVVEFVFSKQDIREQSFIRRWWKKAFRGSRDHLGQEICLVRAFGLKGFRTQTEIDIENGRLLVTPNSPHLDIPQSMVPMHQRLVRRYVSKYIAGLVVSLRAREVEDGVPVAERKNLRITDMVRTFWDQARVVRRGLSPADCRYAFLCSSHTSGSAIDLGMKDMTSAEQVRLEKQLMSDQRDRKIFFIIENSHYHVFVLPPDYMGEK